MNEISTGLAQIEAEINILKEQAANSIIEIGNRLIKAKEIVPHGEWGEWLETKVSFTQNTANRFMRVARELPNCASTNNLSGGKLFELLSLPQETREQFIEENPVEDMTQKELRQAIKEKKELEERLRNMQEPKIITVEKAPKDYESLKTQLNDYRFKYGRINLELEQLQKKVERESKETERHKSLQKQIEELSARKNSLGRQIEAKTELSGLVVEVKTFFDKKFAPIKYGAAIREATKDEIVQSNLRSILDDFQKWIDEMERYLSPTYTMEGEITDV